MACESQKSKIPNMVGIWTSFASIHDNHANFVLAIRDTNLYWYSGYMNDMHLLSYRIENDTLFMFDQLDGFWKPSINRPGRIEIINDSVFWLSSTPLEVLVFERSLNQAGQTTFDSLTIDDLRSTEPPFYRK